MKNISKKTIVISIILLLIGVSVSSAISVDTKSPVVNQQSEEDCGCKEVDSRHLVILEKQLNRLEVYSKLLLVLSKYNPKLKEMSKELSNKIITLTNMFEDLDIPIIRAIICSFIFQIRMGCIVIGIYIGAIGAFFTYVINLPAIANIFFSIMHRFGDLSEVIWDFGVNVFGCDYFYP